MPTQPFDIPRIERKPVVEPGSFLFAAVSIDHRHIYNITKELFKTGAQVAWVYDRDPEKAAEYARTFPQARIARCEQEVLDDPAITLVVSTAVPSRRYQIGLRVLAAGKDFLSDKPPFITQEALEETRAMVRKTGGRYFACYGERLYVECVTMAKCLIDRGEIGRVLHVTSTGPHRLAIHTRPNWFFKREEYGGILGDIGTHQIDQYLYLCGETDAEIVSSHIGNFGNPNHPGLEDFGEALLRGKNGSTGYFNVDWFTPEALGAWSDSRTLITGTEGILELRKYTDIGRESIGDQVFLANKRVEVHVDARNTVGYSYFYDLVLDCIHRTEQAMPMDYMFRVAELSMEAQRRAIRVG